MYDFTLITVIIYYIKLHICDITQFAYYIKTGIRYKSILYLIFLIMTHF